MSETRADQKDHGEAPVDRPGSTAAVVAGPTLVHTLIDRLIARFAEDESRTFAAKQEFLNHAGKVFDDDAELFEARIAAFLEWYVIERPLSDGRPPVEHALDDPAGWSPHERLALAALATSHRSLFDVAGVIGDTVDLEDLLGGARFQVRERRSTAGFEPGQIVEARLLWDGTHVIFGRTFVFHPVEAREEILAQVDRALAAEQPHAEILFQLARQHTRWYRSRNINAARAYAEL